MSNLSSHKSVAEFVPLNIAVLTVSDTRNEETDTSGKALVERLKDSGHKLVDKAIVIDDVYQLRAIISKWIADDNIDAVVCTGGTGFTDRDNTPEALMPLFDKQVEGFGEIFRLVSYEEIGTSTIQSRAFAGMANKTVIFCVPGSTNACKTAWDKVIKEQLDASHRPCNFVPHLGLAEKCQSRG
ncbi:molybdenum cofactor biosynthesis protein B [Thalassotalea sp. 42_200_T64]|nr:molybdenum cofactor biosynthesis protein B [Thalassotalea sp. 42_200_T64]